MLTSYAVNIVTEHSVILLPPAATMPIYTLLPVCLMTEWGGGAVVDLAVTYYQTDDDLPGAVPDTDILST